MTNKITRRNLKNGLFAFIDLLGFSNRVEAITSEEQLRALDDDVVYVQNESISHPTNTSGKNTKSSARRFSRSPIALSFPSPCVPRWPIPRELSIY
jgi:hypothetical protein